TMVDDELVYTGLIELQEWMLQENRSPGRIAPPLIHGTPASGYEYKVGFIMRNTKAIFHLQEENPMKKIRCFLAPPSGL
ncbi:uncharacterized protein METZ01_LOCUS166694, partial [marine metagenome]